ncbi:SIS domain-containing protein [Chloroflexota bacterium]
MRETNSLKLTPTAYLRQLSDLLLSTQVTDRKGTVLSFDEGVERAVAIILSVRANLRKAMVIGNGGSAAIASHMQGDLCNSVGLRATVFTQTPLLTALSNDHGYRYAFTQSMELWADSGDLLVVISSSGQSVNILRAAQAAAARECQVITLSGFSADNPLRCLGDLNFFVSSPEYGYVESAHSVLTHLLTDYTALVGARKEKSYD